tara:strand:+ start:55490 stop:55846 length:357 start_codon:yes stop_codon:yes gene_type:complete
MSASGSKNSADNAKKEGPRLPWWVELLFVQIGLPDKWLPKILKNRSNTIKFIVENNKKILYLSIFCLGYLYLQPYSYYVRQHNICTKTTLLELKEENNLSTKKNKKLISKAINYCNGG